VGIEKKTHEDYKKIIVKKLLEMRKRTGRKQRKKKQRKKEQKRSYRPGEITMEALPECQLLSQDAVELCIADVMTLVENLLRLCLISAVCGSKL